MANEAAYPVGAGLARRDGPGKITGRTAYVDDLPCPNLWYGAVVRAPIAHGRLLAVTPPPGCNGQRAVLLTAKDLPGENIVTFPVRDMPLLAADRIRYRGEPVALVAAPAAHLARALAAQTQVATAAEPSLTDFAEAVRRWRTNAGGVDVLDAKTIRRGDAEATLAAADPARVIEGEYWTGHQEQLYIEPQGIVAEPQADGGVFIHGSMQCPYYIRDELGAALALPPEKIRVRQDMTGGAFGGKEEYPTFLAGYCALLALASGHPIKIVFDRHEDMLYTTKRHPCWTRYRTALTPDGRIAAMTVDYLLDGGAYTTISPVVLARGILHAALAYRCEHVLVRGLVLRTHTFPCGAFRGFGAPQAIFGLESHADELAAACGLSPAAFRQRNAVRPGDTTATGQRLARETGAHAVLERALEKSDFAARFAQCSRGAPDQPLWRGVGLAFFGHGSGFTGDGEARIRAVGAVELVFNATARPVLRLLVSSTEMGQGAQTVLSQIAAAALGVPLDCIEYPLPDTSQAPNSGPTVASRTTMVVGHTVHRAARQVKARLETFAADAFFRGQQPTIEGGVFRAGDDELSFATVAGAWLNAHGNLRAEHTFTLPAHHRWDQETFTGDAYPCYSWGCNVVEVTVDPGTLAITLERVVAVYDVGRIINPLLATGQVEGGLTQAIGYALMEKMGIRDGLYDANRMQTYVIPTMLDIPRFEIEFIECPYDHAEPGAKGLGEIPMDGLAPAIANAVTAATGRRLRALPLTPEALLEALEVSA